MPLLLWAAQAAADVTDIKPKQLRTMQAEGATIIDIRRPDEWAQTGVIEGSHRLTFFDKQGRHDAAAWLAELAKIAGPDDDVVLVCQAGVRTTAVGRYLDQHTAYRKVHQLRRGMVGWLRAGQATVKVSPSPAK